MRRRWIPTLLCLLLLTACRGQLSEQPPIHPNPNMDDQERFDPQEANLFFANARSARNPVAGTQPRAEVRAGSGYFEGKNADGSYVETNPLPVTQELLERGQRQYDIYCSVCHDRVGTGQGMVATYPALGFVPPTNYHDEIRLAYPDGQFYEVIALGVRTMPSYAAQINVEDRWAIVAYIRALQRSQKRAARRRAGRHSPPTGRQLMATHGSHTAPDPPVTYRVQGNWPRTLGMGLFAAGLALMVLGGLAGWLGEEPSANRLKFAYLTAYMYTLSVALGALFFVLLQHVTGARWSIVLRRLCERLMMALPVMPILFVPILFWMPDLFPWARPEVVAADPMLQAKEPYLNIQFFIIRALIYFTCWNGLALLCYRWSVRQDTTGDPALTLKMRRLSAPGIILFALTITFAAFDWMMSLDPHWYSTIFGVYYFAGATISVLSMLVLVSMTVASTGDVGKAITVEHWHDLGKLLFGFVVFWAYIAFSQLLLIWMAAIPEETLWFLHRWEHGGWRAFSWFLLFGHFVLPFLFLLPRFIKRFRPTLAIGAIWMLLMHYFDIFYLIMASYDHMHLPLSVAELGLGLGMLLLTTSYCFLQFPRVALVPVRDPFLADSIAFENF